MHRRRIAVMDLLCAIARCWIISDPVAPVDAIVVLGGGLGTRPPAAAVLYSLGVSRQVIVARAETDRGRHARLNREALMKHGVPPSAISEFKYEVLSTYGEAVGVLEWAKANHIKSIIIPIDMFSTRRVQWIFRRLLEPEGIRAIVSVAAPPLYGGRDWWRHRAGRSDFLNEVAKLAYYRLRY
jgi:uncharacterized SAM-binding protein YcdF (DUF218 family)